MKLTQEVVQQGYRLSSISFPDYPLYSYGNPIWMKLSQELLSLKVEITGGYYSTDTHRYYL